MPRPNISNLSGTGAGGGIASNPMVGRRMMLDESTSGGTTGTTAPAAPAAAPAAQAAAAPAATQTADPPAAAPATEAAVLQAVGELTNELRQSRAQDDELRRGLDELRQQFQNALQPRTNGQQQLTGPGAAPAGVVGQLAGQQEDRGFQFQRIPARLMGMIGDEDCKLERQVSDQLISAYETHGFNPHRAPQANGWYAPLGQNMLIDLPGDTNAVIRQTINGGRQVDPNETLFYMAQAMRRAPVSQAISPFDDSALGIFLQTNLVELIDLLREAEIMSRLGATQITLPPNGQATFGRITGDMVAYWVGMNQAITESEATTGDLRMVAKKLAALVKLPNEMLRFANTSMEAWHRMQMARAMATKFDTACITGVGTQYEPKGVLNHSGIQTHIASTVNANGDELEPKDPQLMLAKMEDAFYDIDTTGFAWITRPQYWANIVDRRADAVSAGDSAGPFLFSTNRDDIAKGAVKMLRGHQVVTSTKVPNDRVKGASSDLTMLIGGVWSECMIGRVGVLEFGMTDQGDTPFVNDQTWLRAIQHVDFAMRRENAVIQCDDLDQDLPA